MWTFDMIMQNRSMDQLGRQSRANSAETLSFPKILNNYLLFVHSYVQVCHLCFLPIGMAVAVGLELLSWRLCLCLSGVEAGLTLLAAVPMAPVQLPSHPLPCWRQNQEH